jgi:hypothetical protein
MVQFADGDFLKLCGEGVRLRIDSGLGENP